MYQPLNRRELDQVIPTIEVVKKIRKSRAMVATRRENRSVPRIAPRHLTAAGPKSPGHLVPHRVGVARGVIVGAFRA